MNGKKFRVRPGRGVSLIGFFGALVFVFLGLFVVIPMTSQARSFGGPIGNFGAIFGVLWTLFALMAVAYHGYNAFSDRGIAEVEIDEHRSRDPKPDATHHSAADTSARLRELQQLRDQDLISADEYAKKRTDILNDI